MKEIQKDNERTTCASRKPENLAAALIEKL